MNLKRTILSGLMCSVFAAGSALHMARQAAAQPAVDCGNPSPVFDLDFAGGTIADYARAIRTAYPCANILVRPAVEQMPAPAISLRAVSLETALHLMAQESISSGVESRGVVIVRHVNRNPNREGNQVYDVSLAPTSSLLEKPPVAPTQPNELGVWVLAKITESGIAIEDTLGAANVALETAGGSAVLRYHEPTGLLIVRGSAAQIGAIQRAIAMLETKAYDRVSRRSEIENQITTIRVEMAEEEGNLAVAVMRKRNAEDMIAEEQRENADRNQPGLLTRPALQNRLNAVQAESDLRVARAKLERLKQMLVNAEKELTGQAG